jgi:hypothetical protein
MRIVFIADYFLDSMIGGAELSLQSHIDTCPYEYIKVRCCELQFNRLNKADDFIVLSNFEKMSPENLSEIVNWNYVFIESDYKYCIFRSSHKHKAVTGRDCDCDKAPDRGFVVDIFTHAKHVFWKSEAQREIYYALFPKLKGRPGTILSGVYSNGDLDYIMSLKDTKKDNRYYILKTGSWIKGYPQSLRYALENHLPFRLISGKSFKDAARIMASCKGLIYLPQGYDTCCRMVTEAKLLGLDLRINDYVQQTRESWFNAGTEGMLEYLRGRNDVFWKEASLCLK